MTKVTKPQTIKKENLEEKVIKIVLNEEQKKIKSQSYSDAISVYLGRAGSGKTLTAVQFALSEKLNKKINKIIITRPTVSKEELGFLPGGLEDKMDPWMQPIYHNMYQCQNKTQIIKMVSDGDIEIAPVAYMRGRTFTDSFIICDEAQNLTIEQVEMIVGRLGKGSKLIFCGDIAQIDLKRKTDSGINSLIKIGTNVDGFNVYEFTTNHRHPIIDQMLNEFDNLKTKK
jgi:phosphate starvation-inducible PhoH-like protein